MGYLATEKGFTIVEVLIAIIILSIGMLSLATLMPTTIKSTNYGKNTTIAANLAQQRIEDMQRQATSNFDCASPCLIADAVANSNPVTAANPDVAEDYGSIAGYSQFRREVYVTNVNANLKDAGVRVTWVEGLVTHQTLLRTNLAR